MKSRKKKINQIKKIVRLPKRMAHEGFTQFDGYRVRGLSLIKYTYFDSCLQLFSLILILGPFIIRGKIRRVLNKTRTGPFIRARLTEDENSSYKWFASYFCS